MGLFTRKAHSSVYVPHDGEALLVIDMDANNEWTPDITSLSSDMRRVARNVVKTLSEWRTRGGLLVFIVYDRWKDKKVPMCQINMGNNGKCIGCDLPPEHRLAAFLKHRHDRGLEPVFRKTAQNAFTNHRLAAFLRSRKVSRVVLAGCLTECCVLATACGAVEHGFAVTLLERCSYPILSSKRNRYHWRDGIVCSDEGGVVLV